VDARTLPRHDLGLLAAAVGPGAETVHSSILRLMITERGLDVHIVKSGHDFALVGVETHGDLIINEHRLPIVWSALDEVARAFVLRAYTRQVLSGHAKWRRRIDWQLACLGVQPRPTP